MAYDHFMTPPRVIDSVRRVFGGTIHLDPASNRVAQEYVRANWYAVHQDESNNYDDRSNELIDGLSIQWRGNIYCNPPYSKGNIDLFVDKAIAEYHDRGNVKQIIMLVNSATDTGWYHKLLNASHTMCLWRGRMKFWKIFDGVVHEKWEGEKSKKEGKGKIGNSPRFLNTLFYMGDVMGRLRFRAEFEKYGKVIAL